MEKAISCSHSPRRVYENNIFYTYLTYMYAKMRSRIHMMSSLPLLPLPPNTALETPTVLRQLARSHRHLAELKGKVGAIPNESILIDTLSLQEAKASSQIENIITTNDELYQSDRASNQYLSPTAKEVLNYGAALKEGFQRLRQQRILRLEDILAMQAILEGNTAGLRKQLGTALKNKDTGEVVYVPPQSPHEVERLMDNFVTYLNRSELDDLDPLVRMAVLHHQFESIHPFYDGNGRTGRILNLLHLVLHGLLDLPVLYLSRYIIRHKADYYRELQAVRETGAWEPWLLYILRGVEETARETLERVEGIRLLMAEVKQRLRHDLPKIYSQELLNNLFRHPYTKIEFVERDLNVGRLTAAKYLNEVHRVGLVKKMKIGRSNFYLNERLFQLLSH